MDQFGHELAQSLNPFADVCYSGVCNTRGQVEQAIAGFEAGRQDLIIVVLLTYAPSHIAAPALCRTRLPVLLFNTQQLESITDQVTGDQTTHNHGMHGVQDLANVLLRAGRAFDIVTGHYREDETLAEVRAWCDAARAVTHLSGMRIGQFGYSMQGMGDFGVDETALLTQVGVEVRHIAMKAVADRAAAVPPAKLDEQMSADRRSFHFQTGITPDEHAASSRLEYALRAIMAEQALHGFTYHFAAVGEDTWLDTVPFLAAGKLLGEGFGFGGEGDVTSAAAVAMLQGLAGAANFTEMFSMDFAGNAVLIMHMGEGNCRMARHDQPVHLLRSSLGLVQVRYAPLLLAFSLEPGEVTLVSLTTTRNGRLKLVATEGEVLDFPYVADLARPHYKFRPACDLRSFLTSFSREGGSHHQALAYGRWAGTVAKVAALLGIEYARV